METYLVEWIDTYSEFLSYSKGESKIFSSFNIFKNMNYDQEYLRFYGGCEDSVCGHMTWYQ